MKKIEIEIDNYPLLGGWENEAEMVDKMLDDIITNRGRNQCEVLAFASLNPTYRTKI